MENNNSFENWLENEKSKYAIRSKIDEFLDLENSFDKTWENLKKEIKDIYDSLSPKDKTEIIEYIAKNKQSCNNLWQQNELFEDISAKNPNNKYIKLCWLSASLIYSNYSDESIKKYRDLSGKLKIEPTEIKDFDTEKDKIVQKIRSNTDKYSIELLDKEKEFKKESEEDYLNKLWNLIWIEPTDKSNDPFFKSLKEDEINKYINSINELFKKYSEFELFSKESNDALFLLSKYLSSDEIINIYYNSKDCSIESLNNLKISVFKEALWFNPYTREKNSENYTPGTSKIDKSTYNIENNIWNALNYKDEFQNNYQEYLWNQPKIVWWDIDRFSFNEQAKEIYIKKWIFEYVISKVNNESYSIKKIWQNNINFNWKNEVEIWGYKIIKNEEMYQNLNWNENQKDVTYNFYDLTNNWYSSSIRYSFYNWDVFNIENSNSILLGNWDNFNVNVIDEDHLNMEYSWATIIRPIVGSIVDINWNFISNDALVEIDGITISNVNNFLLSN